MLDAFHTFAIGQSKLQANACHAGPAHARRKEAGGRDRVSKPEAERVREREEDCARKRWRKGSKIAEKFKVIWMSIKEEEEIFKDKSFISVKRVL